MIIYLAGMERVNSSRSMARLIPMIDQRNTFYSYFYKSTLEGACRQKVVVGKQRVVDSGAHSFFATTSGIGFPMMQTKTRHRKQKTPDFYVRSYIEWIQSRYNQFDYFVELDIQELVGYERVKLWRQWYEKAGIAPKMMWCYHNTNSFQEFEEMVAEVPSRYLGIEGVRNNRAPLPYNTFIRHAYEGKCRIHGFAMVKREYLKQYPFYSVDSSTWSYVDRTGARYAHYKGKFISLRDEMGVKNYYNLERRTQQVLESIAVLENYFTKYWRERGVEWTL
jgi:hypothetical protein